MQSSPFGSWVEYTKQLNALLNFSPHGGWVIGPRHGQSQLISPVSGSYACACCCSGVRASSFPDWEDEAALDASAAFVGSGSGI
ncbi:hypothetical protein BC830DRAFT_1147892 [Chytriomyces sp. MP71]|nr:hypothetical protein BC830DRAFT_1147892 [Chytriomyces sp. MP71]